MQARAVLRDARAYLKPFFLKLAGYAHQGHLQQVQQLLYYAFVYI